MVSQSKYYIWILLKRNECSRMITRTSHLQNVIGHSGSKVNHQQQRRFSFRFSSTRTKSLASSPDRTSPFEEAGIPRSKAWCSRNSRAPSAPTSRCSWCAQSRITRSVPTRSLVPHARWSGWWARAGWLKVAPASRASAAIASRQEARTPHAGKAQHGRDSQPFRLVRRMPLPITTGLLHEPCPDPFRRSRRNVRLP